MNNKSASSHRLAEFAEKIYRAALAEVEPGNCIRKNVIREGTSIIIQKRRFDLSAYENIYLVAFGKAGPAMAKSFMELIGDRVNGGIVVCPPGEKIDLPRLISLEAPHPLPDERSERAAREILDVARRAGEKDLIWILLSGGASAQVCLPSPGVSLKIKRELTRELILRGADIAELNIVRKHQSAVKGGRLAAAAYPARVLSLVISDVIGDDLEAIASGPFHWDSSTFQDALGVLQKYDLWEAAPREVKNIVKDGLSGRIPETLKSGDEVFKRISTFVIGRNAMALEAARLKAERLGFKAFVLTSADRGQVKDAARRYVSILLSHARSEKRNDPLCLLAGGELTLRVKGTGLGGRNQEFALAALLEVEKQVTALRRYDPDLWAGFQKKGRLGGLDWLIMSLGTDGIDGPTDAAGAWAGPAALGMARALDLNPRRYLEDNDSYHFFQKTGGLIMTGPTGTNVMDIRLMMFSEDLATVRSTAHC
jgi:glycerate-2-kinase